MPERQRAVEGESRNSDFLTNSICILCDLITERSTALVEAVGLLGLQPDAVGRIADALHDLSVAPEAAKNAGLAASLLVARTELVRPLGGPL